MTKPQGWELPVWSVTRASPEDAAALRKIRVRHRDWRAGMTANGLTPITRREEVPKAPVYVLEIRSDVIVIYPCTSTEAMLRRRDVLEAKGQPSSVTHVRPRMDRENVTYWLAGTE